MTLGNTEQLLASQEEIRSVELDGMCRWPLRGFGIAGVTCVAMEM
jgi:hypothetical protein